MSRTILRSKIIRCCLWFPIVVVACLALFLMGRAWVFRPTVQFSSLTPLEDFKEPVHFLQFPSQANLFTVTEKAGIIKWAEVNRGSRGVMLDLRDRVQVRMEEGMLSMAFGPQFPQRPYIYVVYNTPSPDRLRLSRFKVNTERQADPKSEKVLLEVVKPNPTHNGGLVKLGPDGHLWMSIGDGHGLDKEHRKKLLKGSDLYGSIIRLDVGQASDNGPLYRIPPDNPFFGNREGMRQEIWAWGLRNPWRFSFDSLSGKLFLGDVGGNKHEEINVIERGKFYGWPLAEGACHLDSCQKAAMVQPHTYFSRRVTRSITGVAVYRGKRLPWLSGKVLFADFTRALYAVNFDNQETFIEKRLSPDLAILSFKYPTRSGPNKGQHAQIVSMDEGLDGEIYLVNRMGGIYRLESQSFGRKFLDWAYMFFNFK